MTFSFVAASSLVFAAHWFAAAWLMQTCGSCAEAAPANKSTTAITNNFR
jgi:hypothetical protein